MDEALTVGEPYFDEFKARAAFHPPLTGEGPAAATEAAIACLIAR